MRIYLISPVITSRLQYVATILFEDLLGLDLCLVREEDFNPSLHLPAFAYGCRLESLPALPSCGLLFETGLPRIFPDIHENPDLPGLFPVHSEGGIFSFDILASAFWILIDGWELSGLLPRDLYGRTDGRHHPLLLEGWVSRPLLHVYARALSGFIPQYVPKRQSGSIQLTLDIDEPWMHAHKPWAIQAGGILKSLLNRDVKGLKQRIRSLSGKEDPFFIFPQLKHPETLTVFFLIDRHDPKDGRHTWKTKAYRELIQACKNQGMQVGIHPSFTSSEVPGRIAFEKQKLEEITGMPVISSRQHFLRYKNPETFRELEACGIRHDYSLCPIYACGYQRGMAQPFLWYDVAEERVTKLKLHPVMVMDRALQKYQGIPVEEAWDTIQREAERCLSYGGQFVILWHNATLSETGEWTGWRKVWEEMQAWCAVNRNQR